MQTALSFSRRSRARLGHGSCWRIQFRVGQSPNSNELVLLTTTTTQDSGILKYIIEGFESKPVSE